MEIAAVIVALLPVAEKVWDLIARAVAGEKLSAEQIKSEMDAAVDEVDARLSRLAADVAANDAAVDADVLKDDEHPK